MSATIATVHGVLALILTYDGTATAPSALGSYAVVATVDDTNHQGSASGTLEINGMIYALWKNQEFSPDQILAGDAEPGADSDGDGLANFAEYDLGTDPHAFTPQPAPALDATHLSLTFQLPKDRDDVNCIAESSDALGSWAIVPLEVIAQTDTHETVRARVERPASGNRLFLRLRFE